MEQVLHFKLAYASFANYSPRGKMELSKKSQAICYGLKNANKTVIESIFKYIEPGSSILTSLAEFINPDVTLVPIPRSAPLVQGGLWPALIIAQAFKEKGLVKNILPCLERIKRVPKSSFAKPGERPSVSNHYSSFKVNNSLVSPIQIVLIDDVLTKGSTMYAASLRIKEVYPEAQIKAFAIIRTMGKQADIEKKLFSVIAKTISKIILKSKIFYQ